MVLGIISIALFFTSFIDLIIAALAVIISSIGIQKETRVGPGKSMAIAGLVTGIVGFLAAAALTSWFAG
jgi:hypothetical protein